jgi:ppGpp synthetase/RelA/SpoT-type nucleotidyltranferase
MTPVELREAYRKRFEQFLTPMASSIEKHLRDLLEGYPRIDRIMTRAKRVESFVQKAQAAQKDGCPKYLDPLAEIQDQIGARIVTYYLRDTASIGEVLLKYLAPIEAKDLNPGSSSAFGYEGKHYIFLIPVDLLTPPLDKIEPNVFELQVKTVFQHAWGEADHDLAYKRALPLTYEQEKLIAYGAAQAWGADRIFDELSKDLIKFN